MSLNQVLAPDVILAKYVSILTSKINVKIVKIAQNVFMKNTNMEKININASLVTKKYVVNTAK